MRSISDYAILGYGIDVVQNEPKSPIVQFTYARNQRFSFQDDLLIPDQFLIDPTPVHTMTELRYSGVMETARDYQRNLAAQYGIGTTVDGVEFSGEASAANSLFEQESKSTVRQYVDLSATYVILRINGLHLDDALLPEVRAAADGCRSTEAVRGFFERFGTHVVKKAGVGGQLRAKTSLHLSVAASKQITTNRVDIGGMAKLEAAAFVSGKIGFNDRLHSESREFRDNSSVSVSLIGGDVTAPGVDAWRDSLKRSRIFSNELAAAGSGPALAPPPLQDDGQPYLGLVDVQYIPIYEVLQLSIADRQPFVLGLQEYLHGTNPFVEHVPRFDPEVPESVGLARGAQTRFTMRGWMATYKTYAGLKARPGAYATVQCKSDAEPGGWTEATVYAGETVVLRDKTPYLSKYMDVKFVNVHGDDPKDDAVRVYARNQLVSW